MSCGLTSGRIEGCFDNVGGIKAIYLFKFVEYPFNTIIRTGQEVTSFPNVTTFKYETNDATFNETIVNDENGVRYDQTLNFTLLKQDVLTTQELNRATKIDLRYLVEFNDGKVKIGGLYAGAQITSIELASGGSKGDLNGYRITISGSEEFSGYFTTLPVFESNVLLLEDGFNYLLETGDKILLNG